MTKLIIKTEEEWQVMVQWVSQSIYSLSGTMFADELWSSREAITLAGCLLTQLGQKEDKYPVQIEVYGSLLDEVKKDLNGPFSLEPINPHLPHGDANVLTQPQTVEYIRGYNDKHELNPLESYTDFYNRVKTVFAS